jgi:hypothetical protein
VEACTPEFPGDGVRTFLAHDYIPMAGSTLTPQPSAATVEACQALCQKAADAVSGCQYFLFDGYAKSGRQCALRLKGVTPGVFGPTGASEAKVLFEVSRNRLQLAKQLSKGAG